MAVHRHVADRDGLHTAMVAALLEDVDVRADAAAELPWTERLRAALLAIHDYNRSHPVLAELLLTDAPRPPAAWRTIEHLLGLLREAGLGSARASEVASILMQQQIALLLLEARALRAAPPPRRRRGGANSSSWSCPRMPFRTSWRRPTISRGWMARPGGPWRRTSSSAAWRRWWPTRGQPRDRPHERTGHQPHAGGLIPAHGYRRPRVRARRVPHRQVPRVCCAMARYNTLARVLPAR